MGNPAVKDSWVSGVVSVLAIAGMLLIAWQFRARTFTGFNDFMSFYSGARLVGAGGLYDAERAREIQVQAVGSTSDSWRFIRLPYFAVFLYPLGKLPYRMAYLVWELLAIGAFAGFVALWRQTSLPVTLLFSSLSLPAFASLMNGQDATFLLLWIALAILLQARGKPLVAGLIFSLCAAKFHLFMLVPLLLWSRKSAGFVRGLALGGVMLAAISFGAGGLEWPRQYLRALADQRIHPEVRHMPNIHGLLAAQPGARWIEWMLVVAVIAATWLIVRRSSFEYGLAATLVGGLLISFHAYLADCSLLLPAALTIITKTASRALRFLAVLLLVPVSYIVLLADTPVAAAVPAAILLTLGLMALEAWRRPAPITNGRGFEEPITKPRQ